MEGKFRDNITESISIAPQIPFIPNGYGGLHAHGWKTGIIHILISIIHHYTRKIILGLIPIVLIKGIYKTVFGSFHFNGFIREADFEHGP